jgi:hypothetical protein
VLSLVGTCTALLDGIDGENGVVISVISGNLRGRGDGMEASLLFLAKEYSGQERTSRRRLFQDQRETPS